LVLITEAEEFSDRNGGAMMLSMIVTAALALAHDSPNAETADVWYRAPKQSHFQAWSQSHLCPRPWSAR